MIDRWHAVNVFDKSFDGVPPIGDVRSARSGRARTEVTDTTGGMCFVPNQVKAESLPANRSPAARKELTNPGSA